MKYKVLFVVILNTVAFLIGWFFLGPFLFGA